jgi:hypothetical protein
MSSVAPRPIVSDMVPVVIPSRPSALLLAKQPPDTAQDAVLLGVVGVVFTGDLEEGGEGGGVAIDPVSYSIGDMLVDQNNANVLALRREAVEGGLDGGIVGVGAHHQKVLLRIGRRRDVPNAREKQTGHRVLISNDGEELPVLGVRLLKSA